MGAIEEWGRDCKALDFEIHLGHLDFDPIPLRVGPTGKYSGKRAQTELGRDWTVLPSIDLVPLDKTVVNGCNSKDIDLYHTCIN